MLLAPGTARVCLLRGALTRVRATVDVPIPRKRADGAGAQSKALERFFEAAADALVRNVDLGAVKVVLLASPGFLREDFHAFLLQKATRDGIAVRAGTGERRDEGVQGRASLALARTHRPPCASAAAGGVDEQGQVRGGGGALGPSARAAGASRAPRRVCARSRVSGPPPPGPSQDVLADPRVAPLLAETRAAAEVAALARFFECLHADADRAVYGVRVRRSGVARRAVWRRADRSGRRAWGERTRCSRRGRVRPLAPSLARSTCDSRATAAPSTRCCCRTRCFGRASPRRGGASHRWWRTRARRGALCMSSRRCTSAASNWRRCVAVPRDALGAI